MNDSRLPYKDDAFDDELYIDSPNDDLLEEIKEMNEEQAWVNPWKIRIGFDSLGSWSIRKWPC